MKEEEKKKMFYNIDSRKRRAKRLSVKEKIKAANAAPQKPTHGKEAFTFSIT
jgi:hypothetical protein